MDWSNDKVIEFLELFKTEPCLWNPRSNSHKNRTEQSDAWRRIVKSLSFPATVEEVKKKKDSLMGYYRIHSNRYKKSLKTDNIYVTNWFAFEIMHSFLKSIYVENTRLNTESPTSDVEDEESVEESHKVRPVKRPHSSTLDRKTLNRTSTETIEVKKQVNESHASNRSTNSKQIQEMDEYDHFALMIAAKIRKIDDVDEREIVMNSIQNLVFDSYMKISSAFS